MPRKKKEKMIPRVRAVRLLLGLTHAEAAEAAQLGLRWYKRWDTEGAPPAASKVEALAEAWGIEISGLEGEVLELPYKEIGRVVGLCNGVERLRQALEIVP